MSTIWAMLWRCTFKGMKGRLFTNCVEGTGKGCMGVTITLCISSRMSMGNPQRGKFPLVPHISSAKYIRRVPTSTWAFASGIYRRRREIWVLLANKKLSSSRTKPSNISGNCIGGCNEIRTTWPCWTHVHTCWTGYFTSGINLQATQLEAQ